MSNPYDDNLAPSEEELTAARELEMARESATHTRRGRSTADDILDAVSDSDTRPIRPPGHCPLCGSPSKLRTAGVGRGTIVRRCTNVSCRNEWPVGQAVDKTEPYRLPSRKSSGPYAGEGGPDMDKNQPIRRKLAERARRAKTHEP